MIWYTFGMNAITIIHIAVAITLSISILLQHRASGLSATFGGSGSTYVQRRGAEKLLYHVSVWLSVAFFALAIIRWYV
jgi:protein translocase SecG subunit